MTTKQLTPLQRAFLALEETRAKLDAIQQREREPIAVVGIGCRAPGDANTPEELWRVFHDGIDAIVRVPSDRWDADAVYDSDPETPGKTITQHAGFIQQIDRFDAGVFGISPREARGMDPQQRLFLEVAWEALERAGIAPDSLLNSQTGVFLGICTNDYLQIQLQSGDSGLLDAHFSTGIAHSVASGRLSYLLGLRGPSISIDTACSSGLVAIHYACQSLRTGETRIAIAGGVNLMLSADLSIAYSHSRMLAPDGRCKAFDAAADGFSRGEGCGVVVLKRLSDALADGDRIIARIRGTAVNQDGPSSGLTAPNGPAQEAVIRGALASGGLTPNDIGYIEAHGTGTQLGDPLEMRALGTVFAPDRPNDCPLYVGSSKTNLGHLEGAAGIIGFIKLVLSLQHKQIAPSLHFKNPSPHIPWADIPFVVPTAVTAWPEIGNTRIGGVSSFGFSGTNVHIVVEQGPPVAEKENTSERGANLITLSAQRDTALAEAANRIAAALVSRKDAELGDVAYTLNNGRSLFPVRAAFVTRSMDEARQKLISIAKQEPLPGVDIAKVPPAAKPRIAFLFTGQGSQYAGMAQTLYKTSTVFRQTLDECIAGLAPFLKSPLLDVLYPNDKDASLLNQTGFAQPALFAIEYALSMLWRSLGIEPAIVLGHSIGEVTAACVAGVFSPQDALKLVAARGRLMQSLPDGGGMLSVFATQEKVKGFMSGKSGAVEIAAINAPEHVVLSGELSALNLMKSQLESAGIKTKSLVVSHAFHSVLMDPILDEFERELQSIEFKTPQLRLISNLTGQVVDPAQVRTPRYWREHIRLPVQFCSGMAELAKLKCDAIVEIGPTPTLTALGQQCIGSKAAAWCASLRPGRDDWMQILDGLKTLYMLGVRVDWAGFEAGEQRRKLDLPTYAFQRERFWFKARARTARTEKITADEMTLYSQSMYGREWEMQQLPPATIAKSERRWVLFGDRGGVGTALAKVLQARGESCLLCPPELSDTGAKLGDGYENLFSGWDKQPGKAFGIIDLRWLDTLAWQKCSSAEGAIRDQVCGSLALVKTILTKLPSATPRLWWVTRGAQATEDIEAPLAPWQAALWGLAPSVALEHPELKIVCIDLSSAVDNDEIAMLVAEIDQDGSEEQVAIRPGKRLVPRLVAVEKRPSALQNAMKVRSDGCYLITGGLTGLGLASAQWLVEQGARHLVLVGRRGASDETQSVLNSIRSKEVAVAVEQLDIADSSAAAICFERVRKRGVPLRGVLHAAGVIDDGAILALDWPQFERVLRPKAEGVHVLDQLTRVDPLDWFIMFSSIVSVIGSPGQANYSAANAVLDCVSHERRRLGLPAQTINWGPWKQIGLAAGESLQQRALAYGLTPMTPVEGLGAFGEAIRAGKAQIAIVQADWRQLLARRSVRGVPPYFSKLISDSDDPSVSKEAEHEQRSSFMNKLEAAPPAGRRPILKGLVRECVAQIIGDGSSIAFDDGQPLGELGMDSLLAVEIRNSLGRALGAGLPATLLFDYPTVDAVTEHLLSEVLASKEGKKDSGQVARPESVTSVLADVSQLREEEIERLFVESVNE